jgi:hypothetical protein
LEDMVQLDNILIPETTTNSNLTLKFCLL